MPADVTLTIHDSSTVTSRSTGKRLSGLQLAFRQVEIAAANSLESENWIPVIFWEYLHTLVGLRRLPFSVSYRSPRDGINEQVRYAPLRHGSVSTERIL